MIWDIIVYVIGILITIPFMSTAAVYFASKKLHSNERRAVHAAVNWTTLCYIIAVLAMLETIFGRSFLSYILVLLLSMFAVIVVFQWKRYTEVVFNRVFKVFWRACFLIFLLLYVLLVLIGVFIYII